MPVLKADDLADTHQYLATARPDWQSSLGAIRNQGGPWDCPGCGGPSYLCYRCSKCGKDLARGSTS